MTRVANDQNFGTSRLWNSSDLHNSRRLAILFYDHMTPWESRSYITKKNHPMGVLKLYHCLFQVCLSKDGTLSSSSEPAGDWNLLTSVVFPTPAVPKIKTLTIVNSDKVNRCLAIYSPRTKITHQPTNRARPMCAQESIYWGKHHNYFGRKQKSWHPHINISTA